jgi:hypothetical protein
MAQPKKQKKESGTGAAEETFVRITATMLQDVFAQVVDNPCVLALFITELKRCGNADSVILKNLHEALKLPKPR